MLGFVVGVIVGAVGAEGMDKVTAVEVVRLVVVVLVFEGMVVGVDAIGVEFLWLNVLTCCCKDCSIRSSGLGDCSGIDDKDVIN